MIIKKLFAVAGYPVLHSKSPFIFNKLFSSMSIPSYYSRLSARSADEAMEMFKRLEISGINVTSPLKNRILSFAQKIDEPSGLIKGVNTLVKKDGIVAGYNTDHFGVSESLREENIDINGKKCLVLGAGSSARAAVYALNRMGGIVTIVNRTYKNAYIISSEMNCRTEVFDKLQSEILKCDIFISTIPDGTESIKRNWFSENTTVFDASYRSSTIIKAALSAGCRVIRGEKWLLNQAIPAFRIFTGQDIKKKESGKLSDTLKKHKYSYSELILLGNRDLAESVKNILTDKFKNSDIKIISDPKEIMETEMISGLKAPPLRILLFSGEMNKEKYLFQFSDMVIPARKRPEETAERIVEETEYVW